jgi:glycosyltransferase involved in cell wall biosynthesis
MKKLSIAIAVLDAKVALQATLDSVAAHLPSDLVDIIIADGGSNDGTEQWLMKEQPAAHLIFGPDAGVYDAMNHMVRRCSTPYILFLGAGDLVLPAMAELLDNLDGSDLQIAGVKLSEDRAAGVPDRYSARWDHGLWWRHVTHHQGVMYPVSSLLDHPYDRSFKVLGDYAVDLELFRAGYSATLHPQTIVLAAGGGLSQRFVSALYKEEWRVKKSRVPFPILLLTPPWLAAKYLFKYLKNRRKKAPVNG